MAIAILVIAFVGFSRTWFFKAWTGTPPLPMSVHVHGLVASAWLLLFLAQSTLIDRHRVDLHRKVGPWGLALAGLMLVTTFPAAIDTAVARGMTPEAIWRMALPFVVAPTFFLLVCLGVAFRRHPAAHKRLMLIATIQALTPALGRIPLLDQAMPASFVASVAFLLGSVVVFDVVKLRRVHVATIVGVIIVGVSVPGRGILGQTAFWQEVAHQLAQ